MREQRSRSKGAKGLPDPQKDLVGRYVAEAQGPPPREPLRFWIDGRWVEAPSPEPDPPAQGDGPSEAEPPLAAESTPAVAVPQPSDPAAATSTASAPERPVAVEPARGADPTPAATDPKPAVERDATPAATEPITVVERRPIELAETPTQPAPAAEAPDSADGEQALDLPIYRWLVADEGEHEEPAPDWPRSLVQTRKPTPALGPQAGDGATRERQPAAP